MRGQRQLHVEAVGQLERGPQVLVGQARPPPHGADQSGSSASVNGATVVRNMSVEAPPMWTSLALTTSASWASGMPAASASSWPS